VDRMIAERNRLEVPEQELRKQQALQPGLLAQAGEAERIKALNEQATKEEVDAVNRTLPPTQKIAYGVTRADLYKSGRVGASEIPPAALASLTDRANITRQLGDLYARFGDLPTGPIAGRLEAYKQALGIDVKDEAVAYRTLLATINNQLGHALFGGALTPGEAERLRRALPQETDPPQTFK